MGAAKDVSQPEKIKDKARQSYCLYHPKYPYEGELPAVNLQYSTQQFSTNNFPVPVLAGVGDNRILPNDAASLEFHE